jgi:hypothetical protein
LRNICFRLMPWSNDPDMFVIVIEASGVKKHVTDLSLTLTFFLFCVFSDYLVTVMLTLLALLLVLSIHCT